MADDASSVYVSGICVGKKLFKNYLTFKFIFKLTSGLTGGPMAATVDVTVDDTEGLGSI